MEVINMLDYTDKINICYFKLMILDDTSWNDLNSLFTFLEIIKIDSSI